MALFKNDKSVILVSVFAVCVLYCFVIYQFDLVYSRFYIPQFILLLPIGWFLYKITNLLFTKIRDSEIIPIMAIIYMIISIICILDFITEGFPRLISGNEFLLRNLLAKERPNINHIWYIYSMRGLIILTFIAFISNFFKSFYTLTSLEYGLLSKDTLLKDVIFNNRTEKPLRILAKLVVIVIVMLQLVIALIFILVEQELSRNFGEIIKNIINASIINVFYATQLDYQNSISEIITNNIGNIGVFVICLYSVMFVWLIIIKLMDKGKKIRCNWFWTTFIQFVCGIIIGVYWWVLSSAYDQDIIIGLPIVDFLLVSYLFFTLFAIGIIITISINEYRTK
jgi:hypothetical protein